jgi:hypothetical protein
MPSEAELRWAFVQLAENYGLNGAPTADPQLLRFCAPVLCDLLLRREVVLKKCTFPAVYFTCLIVSFTFSATLSGSEA